MTIVAFAAAALAVLWLVVIPVIRLGIRGFFLDEPLCADEDWHPSSISELVDEDAA